MPDTTLVRSYERLIQRLESCFGSRLFTHQGVTYPIVSFTAQPGTNILHPDAPAQHVTRSDCLIYDDAHLQSRLGSRLVTNEPNFIVDCIEIEPLRVSGNIGLYYDMIATCDALDHELRDFSSGVRADTPLRDRFFANISPGDALLSGAGRISIIGVAVLTIYNTHDRGYQAMVVQRSNHLATGAGQFHVIPAFVLQPFGPPEWLAAAWSLKYQILREFGEELFAMPEFQDWSVAADPHYFYGFPPVAELRQMLDDGRAELHQIGLALNLLSTRPDICALLIIHDPDWHIRHRARLHTARDAERQSIHHIPVDTLAGLPEDLHLRMVPQGAGAFWLGLECFIQKK